jgi:hypothetical protein
MRAEIWEISWLTSADFCSAVNDDVVSGGAVVAPLDRGLPPPPPPPPPEETGEPLPVLPLLLLLGAASAQNDDEDGVIVIVVVAALEALVRVNDEPPPSQWFALRIPSVLENENLLRLGALALTEEPGPSITSKLLEPTTIWFRVPALTLTVMPPMESAAPEVMLTLL